MDCVVTKKEKKRKKVCLALAVVVALACRSYLSIYPPRLSKDAGDRS